ncbi:MAG: hypothetical protein K2O34_14790 [Acetatifactor sp.]|nr:hypothetical protein [Acetatifactor sp.]
MKKLALLVIVPCMVFGLASCGNADKPVTESDLETWTEKEFEDALLALDSADGDFDAVNQETAASTAGSFEAKQEIIDAAWDSGLLQIDDKLVQLPIHLSEWINLGLDYDMGHSNQSKDYLFTQGESVALDLVVNGEIVAPINFTKETETPETAADIDPLIEKIHMRIKPENVTIYLPGGLALGDSYISIEEKLGKPTEVDENLTYKYGQIGSSQTDLYYGISVYVDRNSQTVSRFEIGKSIQANSRESLTTISFENVPNMQTADTLNVSMLWMTEHKQLPGLIAKDRRVDSVLNDNGKKYYVSLSFNLSGQKYANAYKYVEYGDPILDITDETGMNRKVYNAGYAYIVVCSTDVDIFEATIKIKDLSDSSEGALTALQDLVLEIANSVQY